MKSARGGAPQGYGGGPMSMVKRMAQARRGAQGGGGGAPAPQPQRFGDMMRSQRSAMGGGAPPQRGMPPQVQPQMAQAQGLRRQMGGMRRR